MPLVISSEREAGQTRKLVALAEARSALISAEASCPEDTDEIDAMRAHMGELYDAYTAAYGPIGRFTTRTVTYHVKTLEGVLDRLDFSRKDVPDPEVTLLEAYLGRHALTRIVNSAASPEHVRQGTRKDKQGQEVTTTTQLVEVAKVRTALMTALAQIPQGADAETLTATFGERMSRIETGEQRTRLMPAAFRSDPRRPAVEALETFDPVTQTATKKAVFSRRTAMPHRMELGADTPQEALDLVLIHRRRVDLGEIARLLGTGEAEARAQLGTLVFDDPATGDLVAAGEYLSGNVREKLAAARTGRRRRPGTLHRQRRKPPSRPAPRTGRRGHPGPARLRVAEPGDRPGGTALRPPGPAADRHPPRRLGMESGLAHRPQLPRAGHLRNQRLERPGPGRGTADQRLDHGAPHHH